MLSQDTIFTWCTWCIYSVVLAGMDLNGAAATTIEDLGPIFLTTTVALEKYSNMYDIHMDKIW